MSRGVYVVVMQGVYIQRVQGPFSKEEAIAVAKKEATNDKDSYHLWEVRKLHKYGLEDACFSTNKAIEIIETI